jgi:hypothetical protein
MLEIACHEPRSGLMSQREKRHIVWVWAWIGQGYWVWKAEAFLDQKFQPKRRKSIAPELRTPSYLPVLVDDPRTGDCLYLSFQYPIHDECRGGAARLTAADTMTFVSRTTSLICVSGAGGQHGLD